MAVIGPKVTCHRCGQPVRIEGDGKMQVHTVRGTGIVCVGSRELPR